MIREFISKEEEDKYNWLLTRSPLSRKWDDNNLSCTNEDMKTLCSICGCEFGRHGNVNCCKCEKCPGFCEDDFASEIEEIRNGIKLD